MAEDRRDMSPTRRQYHHVPIYDLRLWIVVSDNVHAVQHAMQRHFGPPSPNPPAACCSYLGSRFGLMFDREYLCHEAIAHEVFHLTHRMMEFCGQEFTAAGHEPFAYLNGYLTDLVYRDLRRWHEPVKATYRLPRLQLGPAIRPPTRLRP